MFKSILQASVTCFINPSFSNLKPSQINKCRSLAFFNLHNHKSDMKPDCSRGRMSDVLEILGPFDQFFPTSDIYPYVCLLRKCIRSMDISMGSSMHAHLIKFGLEGELLVSNVLLDMYAKAGFLEECVKLFDGMPVRDLISCCTIISGFVSHGFDLQAFGLFKRLQESGLKPNHFVISSVLKGCSASGILELGLLVHGLLIKTGFGFDRFVEIGLVDMYAKCGVLDDALKMFYEIPVKSSFSWNVMISGYVQNGFFVEAVELSREMCQIGIVMDLVTLRIVASAGSALEMFDFCKNLHVYSIKIGLDADSFLVAELVRMLTKLGEVDYMRKLFNRVKKPDVSLYSLLISGYHLHGYRVEAVKLAEELLVLDLKPNQGALVSVLNLCLCKEEGLQIHARFLKSGHLSYISVGNALISMYIKFGEMVDANLTFLGMPVRDVVSWTAIMAGLVQKLQFREALKLFHVLRKTGMQLDKYSIVTIVNACTGLRAIDQGKQIHTLALKLGLEFSDFMNASLLHMYAKCGYTESAARLFYTSFPHDLILTNVMLAGYCWNFQPEKALELFSREYQSGVVPDQFSFSTVLGACADIRSMEVGEQIHCLIAKSGFEFSDFIIGNAIINLYVKSGSIASACKFFYSMKRWDAHSYTMLVWGYLQNRGNNEALQQFFWMQGSGMRANPVFFTRVIRGCANLGAFELGTRMKASIIKMGLASDVYIGNAFVGMHTKPGDMNGAKEMFDEIPICDNVPYNSIIARHKQYGSKERALKVFEPIKLEVLQSYNRHVGILSLYSSASSQMHETSDVTHVVQSGHKSVRNSLVNMCTKYRRLQNSWNLFEKISVRDVVLWNFMVSEFAQNGCATMEFFEAMQMEEMMPEQNTTCSRVDDEINCFKYVKRSQIGGSGRALCLRG